MKEKQRNFKQRKTEVMCHQQTHYNGIVEENFLRQKENYPQIKVWGCQKEERAMERVNMWINKKKCWQGC